MPMTRRHLDEFTGAIFLIGLGCLFYFGFWPGILFLLGGILLIRGLARPRGFYDYEGAATLFGLGFWVLMGYNIGALFIIGGSAMLISMAFRNSSNFLRDRAHTAKPKSESDSYLD